MGYLWYVLLGLLALFIAVVVVRTLRFRPAPPPPVAEVPVVVDRDKIIADMADMVRCRTVSYRDHDLEDAAEFEKFRALLQERFPRIHAVATLHRLGRNGLLYHIAGASAAQPTVLMAHYDVVPVEEGWSRPAFDAVIEDGVMWGRGTLDTKCSLCGVVEALEQLLGEGYTPQNDLYLSFSGEEEIDGDSTPAIVSWLEQHGVKPALVLDEGGAVVEKVFPGVEGRCALVGIAEKGGLNLKYTLDTHGGHAATPPVHTVLGRLSRAVTRIERHPFRFQLTRPARLMFDTLGRHSNFLYRMIFANLWCFGPALDLVGRLSGGELNAMMRTTVATTRMQGSNAYNVLPSHAYFATNVRLLGGDTIDSAVAYLNKVVDDKDIRIDVVGGMNPSICSDTACDAWDTIATAVAQTWPDAIVSPYLMMACSDSRHYCRITDRVYRFSPMYLPKELRGLIHGADERVPLDSLVQTVEFYVRLLKML